jgi:hypothetical protein
MLRNVSAFDLTIMKGPAIIHDDQDNPLAVMIPYGQFMEMQKVIINLQAAVERWTNQTHSD